MSPRKSLPMHLEYALLGLTRQQPQYGYDLLQNWSATLGLIWNVKPASLYAALNKLEQQGLLTSTQMPGEASPKRKVFTLTPAGEEAFLSWMHTPVASPRAFRQEWFARLYFFPQVPQEIVHALYTAQLAVAEQWLADQKTLDLTDSPFEAQVRAFRRSQIAGILAYLKENQSEFFQGEKNT
ncbi:MAG TPA: PadR family transcriptional regulator [Anaerolineaceae bacterium]|nr:PadR family transcriptional regulator [Anaerolineaceae bacterium]HOV31154.1 PadR family transcriptional regulator [Anaerolineaceae bacterium]HUM49966.1 PadR family transcriptional regulator [Anaerolineaceae bacterium]